jgi:multiple antibiotic resistance protein
MAEHQKVAWRSSLYATLLLLSFFGSTILRLFGVPLSMVRIVGGIILTKIGFELFSAAHGPGAMVPAGGPNKDDNIAFMPLALPIMCGPGAIATVRGRTAQVKTWEFGAFAPIVGAVLATMFVTYLCLAYAGNWLTASVPWASTRSAGSLASSCRRWASGWCSTASSKACRTTA